MMWSQCFISQKLFTWYHFVRKNRLRKSWNWIKRPYSAWNFLYVLFRCCEIYELTTRRSWINLQCFFHALLCSYELEGNDNGPWKHFWIPFESWFVSYCHINQILSKTRDCIFRENIYGLFTFAIIHFDIKKTT